MKGYKELGLDQVNQISAPILYILYCKGFLTDDDMKKIEQLPRYSEYDVFMGEVARIFGGDIT